MAFWNTDFGATPAPIPQENFNDYVNDTHAQLKPFDETEINATGQQQSDLANALRAQANGTGVNLGQQQMNQATGQAIANEAGAINSVKGINPALAAKMGAENAAAQLQHAAGQSATLNAQQQLQAQAQLANALAQQRAQAINNQATQYNGLTNRLTAEGNLFNTQNQINSNNWLNAQDINAKIAIGNTDANSKLGGALIGAAGNIGASYLGGQLKSGSDQAGRNTGPGGPDNSNGEPGKYGGGPNTEPAAPYTGAGSPSDVPSGGGEEFPGGGSPGPGEEWNQGGQIPSYKEGGNVPGRAQVDGDSPKNDTVHAMLSPGEIVIPRSIAEDGDKAKAFVEAIQKNKKKKKTSYGDVLNAKRMAG